MENPLVCAVLTSYKPLPDVLRNVELLRRQVEHVIVIDNTPANSPSETIEALELVTGCTVIRNGKNLGIATALNIGIQRAISNGFPWIITFDQDSQICDGYVEAMLSTHKETSIHSRVGMLCPRYKDMRLGIPLSIHKLKNGDVYNCPTSGSMIQAETFILIGQMEDNFFIGHVDHEYCLRIRAAGLRIIESPKSILLHSVGCMTTHRVFGQTFITTNDNPKRLYYSTRNRLVLIRRYFFKDPEWVLRDLMSLSKETVKLFLVEKDKLLKAKYIMRGIFDATFCRLGPRIPL